MTSDANLTPREIEILLLIARGFSNKKIAELHFISEYTVETHRKNINKKLGANNTASLLMMARKKGLI